MKARGPVPETLIEDEKKRLVAWLRERQTKGDFPWIDTPRALRDLVEDCLAWHANRGNARGYHDWVAVCRRWIIKADKFRDVDRQRGKREAFNNLDAPLVRLRIVK